jgi:hypothetical protein
MKRINIILSVIGLFSVVGGILAFKTQQRFNASFFCYTNVGSGIPKVFHPINNTWYTTTLGSSSSKLYCTTHGTSGPYKILTVSQNN